MTSLSLRYPYNYKDRRLSYNKFLIRTFVFMFSPIHRLTSELGYAIIRIMRIRVMRSVLQYFMWPEIIYWVRCSIRTQLVPTWHNYLCPFWTQLAQLESKRTRNPIKNFGPIKCYSRLIIRIIA